MNNILGYDLSEMLGNLRVSEVNNTIELIDDSVDATEYKTYGYFQVQLDDNLSNGTNKNGSLKAYRKDNILSGVSYEARTIVTTDNEIISYYPLGINYDNYNEKINLVYEYDDGRIIDLVTSKSLSVTPDSIGSLLNPVILTGLREENNKYVDN